MVTASRPRRSQPTDQLIGRRIQVGVRPRPRLPIPVYDSDEACFGQMRSRRVDRPLPLGRGTRRYLVQTFLHDRTVVLTQRADDHTGTPAVCHDVLTFGVGANPPVRRSIDPATGADTRGVDLTDRLSVTVC